MYNKYKDYIRTKPLINIKQSINFYIWFFPKVSGDTKKVIKENKNYLFAGSFFNCLFTVSISTFPKPIFKKEGKAISIIVTVFTQFFVW